MIITKLVIKIYFRKMVELYKLSSDKIKSTRDDIEEQLGSDKLKGRHKCCRW
jgi:hypothetical protein